MNRRSLVLITIDCLRADHVGFQGYLQPVTPFLDSLAKSSAVIKETIAAGTPTYFSFPAILASRYPLSLGREVLGIAPGELTIATVLRSVGYQTAAFVAANPYLSSRYGYEQGFDTFRDYLDSPVTERLAGTTGQANPLSKVNSKIATFSKATRLTAAAYDEAYFWYCQWRSSRVHLSLDQLRRYPSADILVNDACSWLKERSDPPFFLWLHLMDPHHPYFPPAEAIAALDAQISASGARLLNACWNRGDVSPARLQRYRENIITLYDAGVLWVDKQISRLVSALQQLGRWNETVFAVTADHGEEFLEHGSRYHSATNLPEQLIHVPLLLHTPELSRANVLPGPFSLIHLAPTLLEAVGMVSPSSFHGRSAWQGIVSGELQAEPTISECTNAGNTTHGGEQRMRPRILAVRHRQLKLVIHFENAQDYLYDLENDPQERFPLEQAVRKGERAALLRKAWEHLRSSRNCDAALAVRARLREVMRSLSMHCRSVAMSSAAD